MGRIGVKKKLVVGAVLFTKKAPGYPVGPIGDARIALLRAFYHKEKLHGWIPITLNPFREIAHEDVNWDTAGERVTKTVRQG